MRKLVKNWRVLQSQFPLKILTSSHKKHSIEDSSSSIILFVQITMDHQSWFEHLIGQKKLELGIIKVSFRSKFFFLAVTARGFLSSRSQSTVFKNKSYGKRRNDGFFSSGSCFDKKRVVILKFPPP